MKITKISIRNYRSCISTEFEPHEELSALIGPNGSGKTNILNAIKLLASMTDPMRHGRFPRSDVVGISEIKVCYEWEGKKIIHTAKLNIDTDEQNNDDVVNAEHTWFLYDFTGSKKRHKIPLEFLGGYFYEGGFSNRNHLSASRMVRNRAYHYSRFGMELDMPEDKAALTALSGIVKFLLKIKYYSASQFTNPSNCPISFEAEDVAKSRRGLPFEGHSHTRLLYDIYSAFKADSEGYQQFKYLIGSEGIRLVSDIQFSEFETSTSDYSVKTGGRYRKIERNKTIVIPKFSIGGSELSPSQLSEGTFKTVALLFYLVTDSSSLLMLEEPEVCIHHGLLESIIELIKIYSAEKQIIISTHSDSVLDDLEIENIFRVSRDSVKGTSVTGLNKALKGSELIALKNFLHNDGSLGEFWKNGDLENV